MKTITEDYIDKLHRSMWKDAEKKYGSMYQIPKDDEYFMSELIRGLYVIQYWQKRGSQGNPMTALQHGSVNQAISETIILDHLRTQIVEKKEKSSTPAAPAAGNGNKAKMEKLITNAMENRGKKFTTEQLAKVSGFSNQTVVKHLKSLRYYNKLKRGLYEARDPMKSQ